MKEYFYTITEGMINLGLRGTELNLFAIIFGYSQKGDGCCYATRRELARRCGVNSTNTIDSAMDSLIAKGLVNKFVFRKGEREFVAYSYNAKFEQGTQNLSRGCAKIEQGGYSKIEHMEKEYKGKINKNLFVPPTLQEVISYAKQRGFVDPEGFSKHFIDYYSLAENPWYLSNGKAMKDWKRAVITWEPNNKYRQFGKPTPSAPSQVSRPANPGKYDFANDWN